VDVIKNAYSQRPEGLDKFFYAVDYIIITPTSKAPYDISVLEGGKVIVIDIGEKEIPQPEVIAIQPTAEVSQETVKEEVREKPVSEELQKQKTEAKGKPAAKIEAPRQKPEEKKKSLAAIPATEQDIIIEDIYLKLLDDSSLVVIFSNKRIDFDVSKKYMVNFDIVLTPTKTVFTNLQEHIALNSGSVKFIEIVKDKSIKRPKWLNKYYYAVKSIIIEPNQEIDFETYSNEDGTMAVVEMLYQKTKEAIELGMAKGKPTTEEITPQEEIEIEPEKEVAMETPEEEKKTEEQAAKRRAKEEIVRQELLKEKAMVELKQKQEDARRQEAAKELEHIGKEALRDLIVSGKGTLTLSTAQEIAFNNSPQAKAQKEELELARMKRQEALRALFPQVKVKGTHTTGDVLTVKFIEEVYGVQGDQTVYQGRRLWNTYQQSKVNVKTAELKYNKTRNDIDYKVAEAYYAIVASLTHLRIQKELAKEAEVILRMAQQRYDVGLSTDLELLNVKAQDNQIQFQIAGAERDLALARFKLQQAMNLDISKEQVEIGEVDIELQFRILDVDLYKCLEAAFQNQPDILVNKSLLKSNEYGEKIAKGKDDFKVDVTGFYGRADSYYSTESKNLQPDWNVGVKVSRPFWGNTASYSFTEEKTSRKVGETDRTASKSNTGEFAILDAGNIASEIKEAKVNKQKAENDLIEARRQVALEVKEAYYSYQETIIQVRNSLEKVKFQEEALKVAKAQAELNESLQSQVLEAMIKLADEKAVYTKALSDYNLSLAKLNKAIGIKSYFNIN
jgi:outer membrane protein TolC